MELKEKIQQVFREIFEDDELIITSEMTAEDVEEWDSLTHMELIEAIEKEFKVKFTLQEMAIMDNVGEFISIIQSKTNC